LFQRWQQAGGKGENVQILNGTEVKLLATPAKFIGIPLEVGESLPISMRVDAFKPMPDAGTSREYNFTAQEFVNGELVGGVDYTIIARAQDTDSDGDGIKDVVDDDNDNDGIPDEWEIEHGLNPLGNEDADGDLDGDGVTNKEEFEADTDPNDSDSKPVSNQQPTAIFSITPETGEAPLTVALDASASSDTDGTIARYAWTASNGQAANGQNAEFVFSEAGDYTITLEVTDNDGATNSATKNVKVEVAANYAASGTIRDKAGNPVAGVTVQIGDKTIVTDESGNWKITGLQEGDYKVTATKDGYTFPVKPCAVGNNEDCTVKLKPGSVLDIKVVPNSWKPAQGENVTYTITVTNQGEETATGVVLTDTLPEGTNLVSIEALDGGSCDADTVTCSLPDLTPGATATVKIVISNTQAKRLLNQAIVTASEYPEDMQTTWTTVKPYLSVTLSDTPDPISTGAVLHYTAEVELSHNAPTTTATGVKLVLHLPSGVELKSLNTDYGMCDTSSLPTLTCSLTDLSIDSADSVNQVTVNVDVALQDAGLLLLTHEASVSANEYPSHTDRERTKIVIPEGIEVDIAFVIDVTGSMQEEINGVIRALKQVIEEIKSSDDAPLVALVVFTDDVKIEAFTRDMKVLRIAVEKLKASGGGSCPEASVEALLIAVPHTKEGGDILFATDAAPYAEADVEKVISLLRSKGIRFNAMITGDCSQDSDQNEWLGKE